MPKISEKYKALDNGKADLLGATLVNPNLVADVDLTGGTSTGNIHIQNRQSVVLYEHENNGTNFLALRAPAAVTASRYLSFPDGVPAASTGYFLTSDTSGNMSWAEAGGSTVKISTTEITTSVANVDITIPTTGYSYVYAHLEGIHPVNDGVYLELRSSLDGGSTFENVTYSHMQISNSVGGASSSVTDLRLNYGNTLGNAAREDISGFIYFSLRDAADTTNIQYNIGVNRNTGQQYGAIGYAKMQATGHINSIRLEASSGNLVKGKITLYGVT